MVIAIVRRASAEGRSRRLGRAQALRIGPFLAPAEEVARSRPSLAGGAPWLYALPVSGERPMSGDGLGPGGAPTPTTSAVAPSAPAAPAPRASAPAEPGPPTFGRLESVQLRKYWQDEARDFTPWLAKDENLTLLGEAIGMSLELIATEQYVGPFRADIIARDEDIEVIIENQLDATDHKHLGQLMVYAANRGSGVIVWIARQITDEYRKVIDWLNEKTDVSFFALEVELWRIGNSPVAPKFNIVSKPNAVARAVRESASREVSETAQLQLEFWNGLLEAMSQRDSSFNPPRVAAQHWCNLRIGTSRGHVGLTALRNGRVSCELYMGGRRQQRCSPSSNRSVPPSKRSSGYKAGLTGSRSPIRRPAASRSTRRPVASTTASNGRSRSRGCSTGPRSSEAFSRNESRASSCRTLSALRSKRRQRRPQ